MSASILGRELNTSPPAGTPPVDPLQGRTGMDPLLALQPGDRALLLGNEAIVRGALEAGVGFASGYPGTPSSEITDSFARLAPQLELPFEYSVNEKIALEVAFAASLSGARAICAMKHLGLMVAGDPLSTIPYIGVEAGLVIVSAGDPSCRTSPNEQDQRHLAAMLHLPCLDPATPEEAYRLTKAAFELSEASRLPVLLRPTTRVCHSRAVVQVGALQTRTARGFRRNPARYNPIPHHARRMRQELETRLRTAQSLLDAGDYGRVSGAGPRAVLSSGAVSATTDDVLEAQGLQEQLRHIRLPAVHPLPEGFLKASLEGVQQLLVLEELSPFLEDAIRGRSPLWGLQVQVLGKRTGHTPEMFEYEPRVIVQALHDAFDLGTAPAPLTPPPDLPPRPPTLCPGCPHRSSYFAARSVFQHDHVYYNDIGCYTLGFGPPLDTSDALLSMGSSIAMAVGASKVSGDRAVAFIGDGTFFHSGLPALMDAVKEDANVVVVILDNDVTAMTGFQESPAVVLEAAGPVRKTSIEGVVRSLGAAHVEVLDAEDQPGLQAALVRARLGKGPSVIIVNRACPVYLRKVKQTEDRPTFVVDPLRCQVCGLEAAGLRCGQCPTRGLQTHMARARAADPLREARTQADLAPCVEACPLSLCIQGYAGHVAAGQLPEALELIMERLPLPESVCRVCHRPCEQACVRSEEGGAVGINDLKRYVVGWAAEQETSPYQPVRGEDLTLRVAIIGAGPAGLAAAHALRLKGYGVDLYDAGEAPGGLLRTGIPAFRLPPEALDRDVARVLSLGIAFHPGQRLGRELSLHGLLENGAAAILLAMGAHGPVQFQLEGMGEAHHPPVVEATAFIVAALEGRQAPTDGPVVVIGGGNAALDAARSARRLGVAVTLVCLEAREAMPAYGDEVVAGEVEGVRILPGHRPVRLVNGGLEVQSGRLGPEEAHGPNAKGTAEAHRDPVAPIAGWRDDDTLIQRLDAGVVVLAIGGMPSEVAEEGLGLRWTQEGLLVIDASTGQTPHPKIFAAGDATTERRTVTGAIAAGLRAAWGIDVQLRGAATAGVMPPVRSEQAPVAPSTLRGDSHEPRTFPPPHRPLEAPPAERIRSFDEVVSRLTAAQARAEAERCLSCGRCGNCRSCLELFGCPAFRLEGGLVAIDPALCIGCGVCMQFCPNGAIGPEEVA